VRIITVIEVLKIIRKNLKLIPNVKFFLSQVCQLSSLSSLEDKRRKEY